MCCIVKVCPVGAAALGIPEDEVRQRCPALLMDEHGHATCDLKDRAPETRRMDDDTFAYVMGFGQGCCIKAQLGVNGRLVDFASQPKHVKRAAVAEVINQREKILHTTTDE